MPAVTAKTPPFSRWARGVADGFGEFWLFTGRTSGWMIRDFFNPAFWRQLIPQLYEVGWCSLPVILITGAFVGMVIAVQSLDQFRNVGLDDRLGSIVNLTVVRELGPVLAGMMLAGRIGGALTAELGTMKVTEQIDALRSMGVDPVRHLVSPRVCACLILTPMLTVFADFMGAMGGWFVCVIQGGVDSGPYFDFTKDAVENFDIFIGVLKSVFFGGALGAISCFTGFYCRPGAEGVGRACTKAFVASFITILILDYMLSVILQAISIYIWGFRSLI